MAMTEWYQSDTKLDYRSRWPAAYGSPRSTSSTSREGSSSDVSRRQT